MSALWCDAVSLFIVSCFRVCPLIASRLPTNRFNPGIGNKQSWFRVVGISLLAAALFVFALCLITKVPSFYRYSF